MASAKPTTPPSPHRTAMPDGLARCSRGAPTRPVGALFSICCPGLAARLANLVGKPIDLISNMLAATASRAIATATAKGLEAALKVALGTMQRTPRAGSQHLHSGPFHCASGVALWGRGDAEGRGADCAGCRCARGRCRKLRLYRAFSGGSSRSFHRSPARTSLRQDVVRTEYECLAQHL
jgi:hypothetical protein